MAAPGSSPHFGSTVRLLRQRAGMTQQALAEAAGLHPTYVGMVERAVRNPTLETAERISRALHMPLWKLLREATDPNPAKPSGGTRERS